MKKPMKFKRYDEGGEVADKEAGLKASKGEDVGFFQRLRMGNIDDPNSEAYKRFGAGRGRSERNPVNESVSVNEPRPQFTRREPVILPYKPSEETMKRNTSGMDVQDESGMVNKRLKRNPETGDLYDTELSAPSVKPTVSTSKPMGKPEVGESVSGKPTVRNKVTAPSLGNDDYGPSASEESTPPVTKKKPAAEAPTKTGSSRVPTSEQASANRAAAREKVKSIGSSIADYKFETIAERKARERKEKAAKGYSSGGSVSSASRRADGIATKGKTRGRMC